MIRIKELQVMDEQHIRLAFDDGTVKIIDFKPFIGTDRLTGQLADPAYFRQVRMYPNGRGIYWPNDYDFCPDYLYGHVPAVQFVNA